MGLGCEEPGAHVDDVGSDAEGTEGGRLPELELEGRGESARIAVEEQDGEVGREMCFPSTYRGEGGYVSIYDRMMRC